jgi:hypothetical protein
MAKNDSDAIMHRKGNNTVLARQPSRLNNVVIRDACDREGRRLGRVTRPHDGTLEGIVAAARAATERMYADFSTASNIESRICATDANGKPRWAVSPNFLHVGEIGTDEASYIWCGSEPPSPAEHGKGSVYPPTARTAKGRASEIPRLSSLFPKMHRHPHAQDCGIDETHNAAPLEKQPLPLP